MNKNIKQFILAFIVIFLCTYITYGVEPEDTPPAAETLPEVVQPVPNPIPAPEADDLTPAPTPSPVPDAAVQQPTDPQASEQAQVPVEDSEEAASEFSKELEAIVSRKLGSFYKNGGSGTIGIYIKELKSGFDYGYNAEKTNPDSPGEGYFNSASTCKLFSAAVMYYLSSNGELELDSTYRDEVTKASYNLKKILPKMISHSVNDYFNITLRQLGSQRINEVLNALGAKNSVVYSEIMPAASTSIKSNIRRYGISRSPRTTPKDLAHILELLYQGKAFGPDNNKLFMESLKNNIYSNRLPSGIGFRSPVAHKTGTSAGEGVYNDAGIILLEDNPYIMVVMSKKSGSDVQSMYRSIAKEIYNTMKKRAQLQSSIPQ